MIIIPPVYENSLFYIRKLCPVLDSSGDIFACTSLHKTTFILKDLSFDRPELGPYYAELNFLEVAINCVSFCAALR